MSYSLPFSRGAAVVELGGGHNPCFHPNVDARPGPGVDLVMDFHRPLGFEANSVEAIYCSYALEHVSWRDVRSFVKEVHRVLKPGGTAVFVTANLFEQARRIVEREADGWTDDDVCMIFGNMDYPENSHKCGFSPEFAFRVFRDAGFQNVLILPHPNTITDMIIEARKD